MKNHSELVLIIIGGIALILFGNTLGNAIRTLDMKCISWEAGIMAAICYGFLSLREKES
jgi:hypothetical protein